ncbi:acetyltransferase [Shewanella sp. 0m-8]
MKETLNKYELIGIYGASGFGKEVLPLLRNILEQSAVRTRIVFIDDSPSLSELSGVPVISYEDFTSHKNIAAIIAIADSKVRQILTDKLRMSKINIIALTAESHIQMDDVKIGNGALICDNTMITSNVEIGKSFQMNIYSYVAHDCKIGDYVTFGPRVMCNGNVHVENYAYIGAGAMIKQGTPTKPLIIGEGAFIGMGAVVVKSVPPYSVVFGNPASVIKTLPHPSN